MKAIWENTILAESERTVVIEGNHYFPPDSVRKEYFLPSEKHTTCAWKGPASYYHIRVADRTNADAAWYYPEPKKAAQSSRTMSPFGMAWKFYLNFSLPHAFVKTRLLYGGKHRTILRGGDS